MRAVALILALVPVAYCGWLFFYFLGVGGSVQGAVGIGLGPTMFGLGAIGLLFLLPVAWKLLRMVSPEPAKLRRIADDEDTSASDFDPDAALQRYMARKQAGTLAEPVAPPPVAPPPPGAPRPGFGRKIV